jgi:hypothetical protein
MSAVDNTLSTNAHGAEKNAEITNKGRLQIERGMADLRGRKRTSSSGGLDQTVRGSSPTLSANESSGKLLGLSSQVLVHFY